MNALREQIEILERQVAGPRTAQPAAARCGRCAVATGAIELLAKNMAHPSRRSVK